MAKCYKWKCFYREFHRQNLEAVAVKWIYAAPFHPFFQWKKITYQLLVQRAPFPIPVSKLNGKNCWGLMCNVEFMLSILYRVTCTWNLVDMRWKYVIYKPNKTHMPCISNFWLIYKPFKARAFKQFKISVANSMHASTSHPVAPYTLAFISSVYVFSHLAVLKMLFLFLSHCRLLVCLARTWHQQANEPFPELLWWSHRVNCSSIEKTAQQGALPQTLIEDSCLESGKIHFCLSCYRSHLV